MLLKILMQEEYTQTSSANSEHKHSKIKRFSSLNEWIINQMTPLLSIAIKLSDLH